MTARTRATEIPKLVRRLGSRRPSVVDAARARLAIIGSQAVSALAESLEGDNSRVRANAMPLLALIRDTRGREPLMAMVLDRDPRLRLFSLDYWEPQDRDGIARLYAEQRANGFVPYVATPDLTRIVPSP